MYPKEANGYVLESPIEYTTDGLVWQGKRVATNEKVAIKVIDKNASQVEACVKLTKRLMNDPLQNESIAQMYTSFFNDLYFWIVSELVEMGSVSALMKRTLLPNTGFTEDIVLTITK